VKKALLFDCDGVVATTFPFHFAAWCAVMPPEIEIAEGVVKRNEGAPAFRIAQEIYRANHLGLDEAQARLFAEAKNRYFRQHHSASIYPEIEPLLDIAEAMSCRHGLVTGTVLENLRSFMPEELLQRFHCLVKDKDVEQGKPHPQPYLTAANRLQIPAADCLVVENAPLGIQSALAAQMTCVALTTTLPAEELTGAHFIFADHGELLARLPDLLAGAAI
jgi:beta-phosphoglucomutase